MKRSLIPLGVVLVAFLVVAMWQGGGGLFGAPRWDQPSPQAASPPAEELPASEGNTLLGELALVSEGSSSPYRRAAFGQAWFDIDRNGCDTRNDVLSRDLRDIQYKPRTGNCKVLRGVLDDWYSGVTVDFRSGVNTSKLVQIDHLVPLAWAWRHGASEWSDAKRLRFANDPLNLVATTEEQNQAKGDKGPSAWLPSADGAVCRYAYSFVRVLYDYQLGIDIRNRAMLRGVFAECAESGIFGSTPPSVIEP